MLRGQEAEPVDLAGLRDEHAVQLAQRDRRIAELEGKVRDQETQLARADSVLRLMQPAVEGFQAKSVAESAATVNLTRQVEGLEADNAQLRERLKKLEPDEKATSVKEGG
jgi:chromosome segregation ATPase